MSGGKIQWSEEIAIEGSTTSRLAFLDEVLVGEVECWLENGQPVYSADLHTQTDRVTVDPTHETYADGWLAMAAVESALLKRLS